MSRLDEQITHITKTQPFFHILANQKSVDLHMRSTYQRLVFSSLGDTSGTDTHTHTHRTDYRIPRLCMRTEA